MFTARVVQANITSILESIAKSDLEDAKRKIQALMPEVRTERERGGLLAASGILTSISKGKEGTMQTWDASRLERAAKTVSGSQMADDFDRGYAEALVSYSKLAASSQRSAE